MSESSTLFVGLDVHKESIDAALAFPGREGELRHVGTIKGDLAGLDKSSCKVVSLGYRLHVVYEAGPCGFVVWLHLTAQGLSCEVVAPSSIARPSGDPTHCQHDRHHIQPTRSEPLRLKRKASRRWRSSKIEVSSSSNASRFTGHLQQIISGPLTQSICAASRRSRLGSIYSGNTPISISPGLSNKRLRSRLRAT